MPKKILKILLTILVIALVFLVMVLSKEKTEPIEEETPTKIEEINPTETPNNEEIEEPKSENNEIATFTDSEKEKVENAFSSFLENEEYQTTIQEGDTLVYITFKDLGTVTFKMYDKTAPESVNWFIQLVEENTEIRYKDKKQGSRFKDKTAKFYFATTDRIYNRDEQVDEIFPMKYCLYHTLYSCNNFNISLVDYVKNDIDSQNVDEEYLNYLQKYGGNFPLYKNSVVLGRAVENIEILDKLDENYEIESISVVKRK